MIAAPAPQKQGVGHSPASVLVVEYEEAVRRVTRLILERAGLRVWTAASGQEAVQLVQQHGDEIGLVVLDLILPQLSGVATFRELRRLRPELQVLLTSGYNEEHAARQFAGTVPVGFVQKPWQSAELVAHIRALLEGPDRGGTPCQSAADSRAWAAASTSHRSDPDRGLMS